MVNNEGNAEIMGVVLLIAIFVGAVTLMGVMMLSAPQPEKVPAVAFDFWTDDSHTNISLIHRGGETLNLSGAQLKVVYSDGSSSENPSVGIDGGSAKSWSEISASSTYGIGNSINFTTDKRVDQVQLVWPGTGGASMTGGGGPVLLGAWSTNSSSGKNPPAAVTGAVPITFPYPSEGPTRTQPTQTPAIPWVYFIADKTAVNETALGITFTNLTENQGPYGLLWSFGDGSTSNDQSKSVIHSFPDPATFPSPYFKKYPVTLTLTNSSDNTNTSYSLSRPEYITVYMRPTAQFTPVPTEGNAPFNVSFIDSSIGYIDRWTWDFGDGEIGRTPGTSWHIYKTAGDYSVNLTVANPYEAKSWDYQYIKIHPQVIANFTANTTTGPAPLTVSFNGNSSGGDDLNYSWEFGDGSQSNETQPIHTYTTAGNYTVNLTVSNNYKGSNTNTTSRTINVTAPPLAPPVANFTATPMNGTAPLAVTFTDTSTNNPTSWFWDFGDSTTNQTEQNPQHTYVTPGVYTVTLTAGNTAGNSTPPATKTITVYNNLDTIRVNAGGGSYTDCLGNVWLADQAYNTTSGWGYSPAGAPLYSMDVTIGNTSDPTLYQTSRWSNTGTVDYQFNVPNKDYTVQLKFAETDAKISNSTSRKFNVDVNGYQVVSDFNVYGTVGANTATDLYQTVTVTDNLIHVVLTGTTGPAPMIAAISIAPASTWVSPNFTANQTIGNAQLPVLFTETSTGNVTKRYWDFGDGSTSTQQNPAHTYTAAGTYKVMLTAGNDNQSRTVVKQDYITVYQAPVAAFSTNTSVGNSGMNVSFTNQSTGYVTALTWDFGDGTTGTGPYPTHIFYNNGTNPVTYTVTLNASNPYGSSTTTHTVTIHQPLVANFTFDPVTGNSPLIDQMTSTSTGDGTLTYLWDFGDGNHDTVANPLHTFINPAGTDTTYQVNLTVSNDWGIATITRPITVNRQLIPNFTASPTIGNSPLPVLFNASTSAGANLAYTWTFGDGTSGTGLTPTHTYYNNDTVPVSYDVTLTISNSYGSAFTTRTGLITVNPLLVVNFDGFNREGNAPLTTSLVDLSTGVKSYWNWSFGDGTIQNGTIQNVTHTYTSAGNYTVSLTVGNPYGSNSTTKTNFVRVHPPLVASFTQNQTIGNQPLPVKFTDHSTGDNRTYLWDFGDGGVSNLKDPVYNYTTAGNYTINLTVKNEWGSNSTTGTITILPPLMAYFSGTPTSGNGPLVVYFTDASMGSPSAWTWDFGDGTTGTGPTPEHTYMNVGSYTVTLSVANSYGNSDTTSKTSYVTVIPAAPHDYIADGGASQTRNILDTGYFMFNASNTVSGQSITVGGTPVPILDGDRIKLVIRGDQEGAMDMTSNYISTFTFSNVDLYRNDILEATGAITHVNATVNSQVSTLILEVKAQNGLSLTVDGVGSPPGQAKKGFKIFNLTPDSKGILQYLTGSSGADYTGGGSSHTIKP